jgi:hypothetical protein
MALTARCEGRARRRPPGRRRAGRRGRRCTWRPSSCRAERPRCRSHQRPATGTRRSLLKVGRYGFDARRISRPRMIARLRPLSAVRLFCSDGIHGSNRVGAIAAERRKPSGRLPPIAERFGKAPNDFGALQPAPWKSSEHLGAAADPVGKASARFWPGENFCGRLRRCLAQFRKSVGRLPRKLAHWKIFGGSLPGKFARCKIHPGSDIFTVRPRRRWPLAVNLQKW